MKSFSRAPGPSKKKQGGFSLLELSLVIGILSLMTVLKSEEMVRDAEIAQARTAGMEIYEYNNSVQRWISSNPGVAGAHVGTDWLKEAGACAGGTAGREYLRCAFPNETSFARMTYSTNIVVAGAVPNQTTTATTTMSPLTINRDRPDLAGVAALIASGSNMVGLLPVLSTTSSSYTMDPNTAVITMVATSAEVNDPWLRVDGGNKMHNIIGFDSGNSAMREIHGVSKLFNLAGQSLRLGNAGRASSMGFTVGDGVIIDSDQEILGALEVDRAITGNSSLSIAASATIGGDATINRNLLVRQSAYVDGNTYSSVTHSRFYSITPRMYDLNNTSYYIDANTTSIMNQLRLNGITANGNWLTINADNLYLRGKSAQRGRLFGFQDVSNFFVLAKNNQYVSLREMLPRYVHIASYPVRNLTYVPKPYCPGGGIAKGVLVTHGSVVYSRSPGAGSNSQYSLGSWGSRLANAGGNWRVSIRTTGQNSSTTGYGLVNTYCYR